MTIGNIVKPWSFVNNTETADATKLNANFDVAVGALNDCINALTAAEGVMNSLAERLGVSLNDNGTIKPIALPVGTYDPRSTRTISADSVLTVLDSIILVDTSGGNVILTLLPSVTCLVSPTIINIASAGNSVVITPHEGDTIMGLETFELSVGGESVRLSPGTDTWWRSG